MNLQPTRNPFLPTYYDLKTEENKSKKRFRYIGAVVILVTLGFAFKVFYDVVLNKKEEEEKDQEDESSIKPDPDPINPIVNSTKSCFVSFVLFFVILLLGYIAGTFTARIRLKVMIYLFAFVAGILNLVLFGCLDTSYFLQVCVLVMFLGLVFIITVDLYLRFFKASFIRRFTIISILIVLFSIAVYISCANRVAGSVVFWVILLITLLFIVYGQLSSYKWYKQSQNEALEALKETGRSNQETADQFKERSDKVKEETNDLFNEAKKVNPGVTTLQTGKNTDTAFKIMNQFPNPNTIIERIFRENQSISYDEARKREILDWARSNKEGFDKLNFDINKFIQDIEDVGPESKTDTSLKIDQAFIDPNNNEQINLLQPILEVGKSTASSFGKKRLVRLAMGVLATLASSAGQGATIQNGMAQVFTLSSTMAVNSLIEEPFQGLTGFVDNYALIAEASSGISTLQTGMQLAERMNGIIEQANPKFGTKTEKKKKKVKTGFDNLNDSKIQDIFGKNTNEQEIKDFIERVTESEQSMMDYFEAKEGGGQGLSGLYQNPGVTELLELHGKFEQLKGMHRIQKGLTNTTPYRD